MPSGKMDVDSAVDIGRLPDINKATKAELFQQLGDAGVPAPKGQASVDKLKGLLSLSLLGFLNERGEADQGRLSLAEAYWKMQVAEVAEQCIQRGKETAKDKKCILAYWLIRQDYIDSRNKEEKANKTHRSVRQATSNGTPKPADRELKGGHDTGNRRQAIQDDHGESQSQQKKGGIQSDKLGEGSQQSEAEDQRHRIKRGRLDEVLNDDTLEIDNIARLRAEYDNLRARNAIAEEAILLRIQEETQRAVYEKQKETFEQQKRVRIQNNIKVLSSSADLIIKMARQQTNRRDQPQMAQGDGTSRNQAWQRELDISVQKQEEIRRRKNNNQKPSRDEEQILQQDLQDSRLALEKYLKDREGIEEKARKAIDDILLEFAKSSKEMREIEADAQQHIYNTHTELNDIRKEIEKENDIMVKELAGEQVRFANACYELLLRQGKELGLPLAKWEAEATKLATCTADLLREFQ